MASRIVPLAWSGKPASICLALWFAIGLPAQQVAAASDPQDVAQGFYRVLLITMRDGRSLGQSGRYARLVPVVNRTFDLAFMARLAVGPSWATLAPAQQQRLTEAFGNYVSATYADRFDSYSGEHLEVTGSGRHLQRVGKPLEEFRHHSPLFAERWRNMRCAVSRCRVRS